MSLLKEKITPNYTKYMILILTAFGISFIMLDASVAANLSRRSFLGMMGAGLGTAAMGPKVTMLADKVLATNVNEAQRLMQIRSSLDFDFIRRARWERYLTGKVSVSSSGAELSSLQAYRQKLFDFISHQGTSPEGKSLAKALISETNKLYPFDISQKDYVEKSKKYFQRQRQQTIDYRSEEVKTASDQESVYEEIQERYDNGIARCQIYLH